MAKGDATARPAHGVDLMANDLPGWTAVVAESVPGASVREVCRIGGGTSAETFAVETTDGAVVVKGFRRQRHKAVRFEWEQLCFAQRVDAPVPSPLALDTEGRWFGRRAFRHDPPRRGVNFSPGDVDGWLQQLASALVAIHHADTTGADGPLLRPSPVKSWRPPKLREPSPLADRTVAAIQRHLPGVVLAAGPYARRLPPRQHVVGPRPAHWHRGLVRVPARAPLVRARLLSGGRGQALLLGSAAANRLTHHYATIAGAEPADLPVFDLIWGLDALRKQVRMLKGFRQQGLIDNLQQFTARATAFLRQALAELGRS